MDPERLHQEHIDLVGQARAKYEAADKEQDSTRAAELDAEGDRLFAAAEAKLARAEKLAKVNEVATHEAEREDAAAARTMRVANEAADLTDAEKRDRTAAFNAYVEHGRDGISEEQYRLLFVRKGAHERAWNDYLRTGSYMNRDSRKALDAHERKVQVGETPGAAGSSGGGYTVPEGFLARVIEKRKAYGPMGRPGFTDGLTTASGNDLPAPTEYGNASNEAVQMTAAGNTTGESLAIPNQDPNFGRVVLRAHKFGRGTILSSEVIEDTGIDILGYIENSIAMAFGRAYNKAFTRNTSATAGPTGIFNVLNAASARRDTDSTVTATSQRNQTDTAGTIKLDDALDTIALLDPDYRDNALIMMHDRVRWILRKAVAANVGYLWEPSLQVGMPQRFEGLPVYVNQALDNGDTAGENCLVVMDPMSFFVRRVGTMRIKRGDEVRMANDEVYLTAVERVDSAPVRPDGFAIMQTT